MKNKCDIMIEDDYVLVRPKPGMVLDDRLSIEILSALYSMKEYTHEKDADLWDFRECRTTLNFDGVSHVVEFMKQNYDTKWSHKRTAFVLDADVQYGLTRMYQTLVDELSIDVRLFRDFDEAVSWLKAQGQA